MNKPPFLQSNAFALLAIVMVFAATGIAIVAWQNFTNEAGDADTTSRTSASPERKTTRIEKPPLPRSDYIGSTACAECHSQIAEIYQGHSMAHSLTDVASASPIEDYVHRTTFSPDGHHSYRVEKTPEGLFHHERLTDEQGQEIYDQSVQIGYVMGSGHQGRAYLIDREGLFFMSPISWYSHAERWDLSPQYKLPRHRRFERRMVDRCLDCHTGRVNSVRGADDRFQSPPFIEQAIGCERCHGPGGEHASLHRRGPVSRELDPIANPARMESAAREDVCAHCHLQGEGNYSRYGCDVGDYRPGQRLEDTTVIFVSGTRTSAEGTTRAVSQVEQMKSSRCFEASDGKFGCISCHDPHSRPAETEIVSFYQQKCLGCHDSHPCSMPESDRRARHKDDSCIACHMPRLGASDVPHTAQTDHRVLRKPKREVKPVGPPPPPEFYDHAEKRLPQVAIDYARGLWLAEHGEKRTDPEMANRALLLLSKVAKDLPDDARIQEALGTASSTRQRYDDSVFYWQKTLSLAPDRESTLENLGILLSNLGRVDEARPYFEHYLKLNPWKSSVWGRYARVLAQQNDWQAAIDAGKKSLELDPSEPLTYQFLAEVCRQSGDLNESRRYSELFERIRKVRQ